MRSPRLLISCLSLVVCGWLSPANAQDKAAKGTDKVAAAPARETVAKPLTEKIGKVQRILGVRPSAFATSLAETYRWYLRQPKLKADFRFEDGLLRSATTTV